MADRTHSTVETHSVGNLRLSIIAFTDIDDGDTYDSGLPAAVSYWATATDDPTINRENVMVKYQQDVPGGAKDAGRFTFLAGEDNRVLDLYVLSRT